MKKRSLSFFLAILMVFGSVLPVFATEPTETTTTATEEQTSTKTEAEAFADMYVTDDLLFIWDSYTLKAFEGTTLTGADGKTVNLVNALASGTSAAPIYGVDKNGKGYVSTEMAIDFSNLISRAENGKYLLDELEFELVMSQVSNDNGVKTLPKMDFGPLVGYALGATVNPTVPHESYGGYGQFYMAYGGNPAQETFYVYKDTEEGDAALMRFVDSVV